MVSVTNRTLPVTQRSGAGTECTTRPICENLFARNNSPDSRNRPPGSSELHIQGITSMKTIRTAILFTATLSLATSACGQNPRPTPGTTVTGQRCQAVDTATANAPEQKPAFPGQTRACAVRSDAAFDVTVVAKGLKQPWAVEPLPGGDFLITEKSGQMRIVTAAGAI